MLQSDDPFAALLQRARQGDEAALAELLAQYEPELRVAARVRLGPALRPYLDSLDVVQSVHHILLRGLKQDRFDFPSPEHLLALAVRLVRNRIARHWRRHRRQQRLEGNLDGDGQLDGLLVSLSDPGPDPARNAQLRDQLVYVCRDLDTVDRQLLELRLQGHTTAEAASLMGQAAGFLRVRLQRLRERLAQRGVHPDCL